MTDIIIHVDFQVTFLKIQRWLTLSWNLVFGKFVSSLYNLYIYTYIYIYIYI